VPTPLRGNHRGRVPLRKYYKSFRIAITGSNSGKIDAWLIKFDFNGSQLWQQQWGTSEDDLISDIAVNRFSEIYILGLTNNSNNKNHKTSTWIKKYNKDGSLLWEIREIQGQSLPYSTQIYRGDMNLEVDDSGNFYITGTIFIPIKDKPDLVYPQGHWIIKYSDNK
jgi:hypothetical protein